MGNGVKEQVINNNSSTIKLNKKKTATKKREKIEYKKGEKENNCIV